MKKKTVKVKQKEPEPELQLEPELTVTQTPLGGFSKKIFYPSFKFSSQQDLKLANKNNIHFKRIRISDDILSNSCQRLIKRNLKYIRKSELCTFHSRPSLYLIQELNQQERNQQCFPNMAAKPKRKAVVGLLGHEGAQAAFHIFGVHNPETALGLFGYNNNRLVEEKDMANLFRFLCQNKISIESLKLFSQFASDQRLQRKYMKYRIGIRSLKMIKNVYLEQKEQELFHHPLQKYPEVELDQIYKQSLAFFGKLKRISLDFAGAISANAQTQTFLCDIVKMLSQISSLKAIEITMNFKEIEKKVQKLKAFTEKLTELKSLKLNFCFAHNVSDTGKAFTTLLPLNTLKHLSINLPRSKLSLDCSDLGDFIGSMKNLETFKFHCDHLLFDEHLKIFQGIQKVKSLTKLKVIQRTRPEISFAYGILFKALTALKKLTSINIDLGHKFDDKELHTYLQHLVKHPALKEAKIALQVPVLDFNLTDEFFANLHRLRKKLSKLHLKLVYFPIEAQSEIKKIIISGNEKDLKHYSCQIVELPDHLRKKFFGAAVNHNDYDGEE